MTTFTLFHIGIFYKNVKKCKLAARRLTTRLTATKQRTPVSDRANGPFRQYMFGNVFDVAVLEQCCVFLRRPLVAPRPRGRPRAPARDRIEVVPVPLSNRLNASPRYVLSDGRKVNPVHVFRERAHALVFFRRPITLLERPRLGLNARHPGQHRTPIFSALIAPRPRA